MAPLGNWMTNRSKPALAGMLCTVTFMTSLRDPGVMVTRPVACGRHAVMFADVKHLPCEFTG